jgi:hypothetical protein
MIEIEARDARALRASAIEVWTAVVDFPVPPFSFANTRTCSRFDPSLNVSTSFIDRSARPP